MRCHLCTERTTRNKNGTRQNLSPVRFFSIYNNSLLSKAQKRIYPFQCLATDSIAKQFAFKTYSVASSFRTLGWSSSGPKALEGFKPLRILITLSLETTISSMKGADLSRSGTCVFSFLLNTSVNWPLNSAASSRSDWATPFPFFHPRGGIPWMSFFWLLMVW